MSMSDDVRVLDGWKKTTGMGGERHEERHILIADILARWWYVFPMWPPQNYDWKAALKRKGRTSFFSQEFFLRDEEDVGGS